MNDNLNWIKSYDLSPERLLALENISPPPKGLESCNPYQRTFPISWKEAYFRMNFNDELGGYVCPICKELFSGNKGFSKLRADHIHPFSKNGLTIWQNLQLLCVQCNSEKSNKV